MCLYWAITGPRFLSPTRHLLAVALTRQSPAPNAMWQCWDYNIWPVLPGINAITAPRPLRWDTPGLRRERDREIERVEEEGGGGWWWDGWMNLRKWREAVKLQSKACTAVERRQRHQDNQMKGETGRFCLILWCFKRMRSRRNCGLLWCGK